ncbi:putative armadillo-like helical protein [Helianthus anomalus]
MDLVPAYVRLLRDNESEVRIAAAGKVTKFSRFLSLELVVQHILPRVKVVCFINYKFLYFSFSFLTFAYHGM